MIHNQKLMTGLNILCDQRKHPMFMDVQIWKAQTGMTLTLQEEDKETAILLIEGKIKMEVKGQSKIGSRLNVFEEEATVLHISCHETATIHCLEECEVLIQQTLNPQEFPPVFYDRDNITREVFGDAPIQETTRRIVTTVFDYNNAPYSKMVLGEIINQPGIWSSYPPHFHPQPEVYYYRFNKPQGFGTCYVGEECFKVHDHSIALIEGNKTHPQNAAPGYAMYYVWMIPHTPTIWQKTRTMDEDHVWLLDKNAAIIQVKED